MANWWDTTKNFISQKVVQPVANWWNDLTGPVKQSSPFPNRPSDKNTSVSSALLGDIINGQSQAASTTNIYQAKTVPSYTVPFSFDEEKARESAVGSYDPYYKKLTSEASSKYDVQSQRAREDLANTTRWEQQQLDLLLEQSGLLGKYSKEDLQTALNKLAADRGEARAQTAYDRARQLRSLVSDLSGSGLQFGGFAATQGKEFRQGQSLLRNQINRAYTEGTAAAETANVRTMEDLSLKEKGAKQTYEQNIEKAKLDEARTQQDISTERSATLDALNAERKYKIEQSVNDQWTRAYQEWELGLKEFMAKNGVNI